jgi:hypothetical protein
MAFIVGAFLAVVILALLAGWIAVAAASLPPVTIRLWPATYQFIGPGWVLPLAGVMLGLVPLVFFAGVLKVDPDEMPGISPIIVFAFLLAGLGAANGQITFLSACIVVPLALGALATVYQLLTLINFGGTIEVESRWGGLGGGLGGWRLSREASLLLLALALIAGTVAAVQPVASPTTGVVTEAKRTGEPADAKAAAQSGSNTGTKPASGESGAATKP